MKHRTFFGTAFGTALALIVAPFVKPKDERRLKKLTASELKEIARRNPPPPWWFEGEVATYTTNDNHYIHLERDSICVHRGGNVAGRRGWQAWLYWCGCTKNVRSRNEKPNRPIHRASSSDRF